LTHICFFGGPYCCPSQEAEEDRNWKDEIDNELDKITDGNVIKLVKVFMDTIVNRDDNDCSKKHSDLQFITDVMDANKKDYNENGNPIHPPYHLYALIKAKPEFMKRGSKEASMKEARIRTQTKWQSLISRNRCITRIRQ
jgi:hypothetical protein